MGHLGEEAQTLVLPSLDHVEIRRVFLDQRSDERARVADVPGLVAHPRAMVHGGEQVTARLGAVREDGEGGRAGGTLGHEVRLDENLDGVLELQHVPEESARGAGLLPCREPVSLGDAGPLEHVPVHLEVALLVGELERGSTS